MASAESGRGLEQAKHWEHALRQALMPVTPQSSNAKDSENRSSNGDSQPDQQVDISQLYQIFPEDVLGSGQFGIVYGGTLPVTRLLPLSPYPEVSIAMNLRSMTTILGPKYAVKLLKKIYVNFV